MSAIPRNGFFVDHVMNDSRSHNRIYFGGLTAVVVGSAVFTVL